MSGGAGDAGSYTLARTLDEALTRRRMTLTRARSLLAHRGHAVSLAALSYWRSGQRLPEGLASFEALDALDEILGLPDRTLRDSVGPSRRPGFGREPHAEMPDLVGPSAEARAALLGLGLDLGTSDYVEESVMVAVDVDHRGQETRCTSRVRVRALRDGVERHPLVIDAGVPLEETVEVAELWGCRLGRSHVDLSVGLTVYELLLERTLSRGETAVFEFRLDLADVPEAETEFSWHFARQAGETEVWVRFDPRMLPVSAEGFTRVAGGEETVMPLSVAGTTTIVHGARRFGPGTVGLRWSWPSPDPRVE